MPNQSKKDENVMQQSGFRWQSIIKWLSFSLAGALFLVGSLVFYVYFSLIETNRFMEITGPLVEKPAVQKALATKMTDSLFEKVDVEKIIEESLPERASFLAPSIATQVKVYTQNTIENIVKNEKFQVILKDTLSNSHSAIITSIKEAKSDGTININDIYSNLRQKIDNPKLQFVKDAELPSQIGSIKVLESSWLPVAHQVVVNVYLYQAITILVLIILTAVFVWFSRNRHKAFIQLGVMFVVFSVVMFVSVRITKVAFIQGIDPTYVGAVSEVWSAFFSPFAWQLFWYGIAGLGVALIAWATGDFKLAVKLRNKTRQLLANIKQ